MKQRQENNSTYLSVLVSALLIAQSIVCVGAQEETNGQTRSASHSGFSWEMPGRVSIFDLQFGPAAYKDGNLSFGQDQRSISVDKYPDRLTLAVRFSYQSSQSEVPLKFMIRLPETRQYEETVRLPKRSGHYTYHFTIHNPRDFLGTGYIYLYYGFSIVDVLDFDIHASR